MCQNCQRAHERSAAQQTSIFVFLKMGAFRTKCQNKLIAANQIEAAVSTLADSNYLLINNMRIFISRLHFSVQIGTNWCR